MRSSPSPEPSWLVAAPNLRNDGGTAMREPQVPGNVHGPRLATEISLPSMRIATGPFEPLLEALAIERQWSRIAVICGPGLARSAGVKARLPVVEGRKFQLWTAVEPHAPVPAVEALARQIETFSPDVVVSAGGGSSHDLAKGVVTLLALGGSLLDHCLTYEPPDDLYHTALPGSKLPIVTVPSTLAGSEANGAAGFTDLETGRKRVLADPTLFPTAVLIDETILSTTPREIFLGSMMNALNHCVEGLSSRRSNVVSEALLTKAFVELVASTPTRPPAHHDRVRASMASVMAGIGLSGSWLGLAHAIGHALGARYRVPHGWCHAVMAGEVIRFNSSVSRSKHERIAAMIGIEPSSEALASWMDARSEAWGLPRTLGQLGVERTDLDALADVAWHDHDSYYNPRRVSKAEILQLLDAAY